MLPGGATGSVQRRGSDAERRVILRPYQGRGYFLTGLGQSVLPPEGARPTVIEPVGPGAWLAAPPTRTVYRAPVVVLTHTLWPQVDPDRPILRWPGERTVPRYRIPASLVARVGLSGTRVTSRDRGDG